MIQEIHIIPGTNYGDFLNNLNKDKLSKGWIVMSVVPQNVHNAANSNINSASFGSTPYQTCYGSWLIVIQKVGIS